MNKNYKKLLLSLAASFLIMYLVMFLNVVDFGHIYFSLTRLYMALLMVSAMALLMVFFMRAMYTNKKFNLIIVISSVLVFALALLFLRKQMFISDSQYLKAMIPHHSSAILTSQKANLKDVEVKALSEDIIEAQEREIEQMQQMLEKLD